MIEQNGSLNAAQEAIVAELYEATMDFSLGSQHEGVCELESGIKGFVHRRNCHLCRAATVRRRTRLEAAATAAGPVLRPILK